MQDVIFGALLSIYCAALFYKRRDFAELFRDGAERKIADLKERLDWAECCADDPEIKSLNAWIALYGAIQRCAEWVLGERKEVK